MEDREAEPLSFVPQDRVKSVLLYDDVINDLHTAFIVHR